MAKKYIDAGRLKELLDAKYKEFTEKAKKDCPLQYQYMADGLDIAEQFVDSLQQEQPEENKLVNKRARVNYAICKLQSFKPIREAIVLDDYVYDEGKCYRENLLNYIHAIPENRLTEIRSYLKENGWWPYDDDADWMKQEQPEVDLDEAAEKYANRGISSNADPYEETIAYRADKDAFKAGAEWQKEQMMKNAVQGTVHNFSSNVPHPTVLVDAKGFNQGDKVRVIIVKEEG